MRKRIVFLLVFFIVSFVLSAQEYSVYDSYKREQEAGLIDNAEDRIRVIQSLTLELDEILRKSISRRRTEEERARLTYHIIINHIKRKTKDRQDSYSIARNRFKSYYWYLDQIPKILITKGCFPKYLKKLKIDTFPIKTLFSFDNGLIIKWDLYEEESLYIDFSNPRIFTSTKKIKTNVRFHEIRNKNTRYFQEISTNQIVALEYLRYGNVLTIRGEYFNANQYFNKSIELDSLNTETFFSKISTLINLADYTMDEIEYWTSKILSLDSTFYQVDLVRAVIAIQDKDTIAEEKHYRKALKRDTKRTGEIAADIATLILKKELKEREVLQAAYYLIMSYKNNYNPIEQRILFELKRKELHRTLTEKEKNYFEFKLLYTDLSRYL